MAKCKECNWEKQVETYWPVIYVCRACNDIDVRFNEQNWPECTNADDE